MSIIVRIITALFFFSASFTQADTITSLTEKAQQQDPQSQYLLAQSYDLGVDVEANADNAFYWYSQAAENGHIKAQLKLANFLASGIGTEKNPQAAIRWYSQLASRGNPTAPLELAKIYEHYPSSTLSPLDLAEVWYQVATYYDDKAQDGYSRVLEAKFNARREKQISEIEQLNSAFSEEESSDELIDPNRAPTSAPLLVTSDYLSISALLILLCGLAITVTKVRAKRSHKENEQNQALEAQIKSKNFTIKQLKRQLGAMFRDVKKYQASKDVQKLKIACALFGYSANSIPPPKSIKIRYKQLSKIYHPDLHGSDDEMKRLNASLKTILQNVTKK